MNGLPRCLGLSLAALVALSPTSALAHQANSYYDLRWMTSPEAADALLGSVTTLDWAFSPTVEPADRDAVAAASDVWNEHADRLRFQHVGDVATDAGMNDCPAVPGDGVNVVRRGEIDGPAFEEGGILALASLCPAPVGGIVHHFTITYDETEPWYVGSGPVPIDQFDLQGILAHEFGHATGWGRHFEENTGTECIEEVRHTMCSTVSPGTLDPRTLEPHDIDTWQDAY